MAPLDQQHLGDVALRRGVILIVVGLLRVTGFGEMLLLLGARQGLIVGPATIDRPQIGLNRDPKADDFLVPLPADPETVAQVLEAMGPDILPDGVLVAHFQRLRPRTRQVVRHLFHPRTFGVTELRLFTARQGRAGGSVGDDGGADLRVDDAEGVGPQRDGLIEGLHAVQEIQRLRSSASPGRVGRWGAAGRRDCRPSRKGLITL